MKYCGIELKSSEARIVGIQIVDDEYEFIAAETKKIMLNDSKEQEAVLSFREAFGQFFESNNFDKIGIKERGRKGKFAGGADSFKMEGILQTLNHPIEILHVNTIKSKIKGKVLKTEHINKYQEEALKVAVSFI